MDSRGTHDLQVENGTSSDEFVLHARLPSLQEMAYNQIAVAVWYSYRSTPSQRHCGPSYYEQKNKPELMDCYKLMKTLAIPRFMKEILNKYLKRVVEETIRCAQYFGYVLLSENLDEYRIPQVDWEYFVWCPYGRINYESTAIKMLHSNVLTEVQKFAIVSNFCLENEIKIFDLNRLPMETFIAKVNEDCDFLLYYWICYLKNELHSMASFSIRSSHHRDRLNSMYYKDHGGAFEYFWNRLSAEDQVSFIVLSGRLSEKYSRHWHRRLFYKMSHEQLTNLLSRQPIAIISYFTNAEWGTPEWAIMAWKRCKNCISDWQFVELLHSLITSGRWEERKMSVLLETWNTANDRHKNYAARLTQLEGFVVSFLASQVRPPAPSALKFLLKFLSLKSAHYRENLYIGNALEFICNFDLSLVDEIFELLYLPNFQHKVDLETKHSIPMVPYFCEILYSEEDEDELNRRLLRSFQNLNIPLNDALKKCIESWIAANKKDCWKTYTSEVNDTFYMARLSKFIKKILPENVSAVLKMKQSYISSFSAHSDPYERNGSLNELSKIIEQEFVLEHLQEFKCRLVEILQTASVEDWVIYADSYNRFVDVFSWFSENEEEMFLQVKSRIPINSIIGKVLENIIHGGLSSFYLSVTPVLNNLERFLEWYFSGVAEEVISFKLGIMNDPETAEILENIKEHVLNQALREKFLQWNWPV